LLKHATKSYTTPLAAIRKTINMEYTEETLKVQYNAMKPLFERTCSNIKEVLTIFLKENDISFLAVSTRVKDFDSFFEKIDRKKYSNPFNETEDFCGSRIILYYLSDIEKVNQIIHKEFDVQDNEDKIDKLDVNEFGYRSYHFIVQLKEKWLETPNYRGLKGIKIEIQIRTVLMHAWAEIEHKLGYKNKDQVPKELSRKLYLISAKLEEADGQFQELVKDIGSYKNELISKAVKKGRFTSNEFNLNTMQALMDYYFPEHEKHEFGAAESLKEIKMLEIPLEKVVEYVEKIKPIVPYIDKKLFGEKTEFKTHQSNLMSYAIQAFHPGANRKNSSESRLKLIEEIELLGK
jgi:ppGpp synthetase/RelA/SpoT-type nucleotidyltranferase